MKVKATYIHYLFIGTFQLLWTLSSNAQPGDRPFSFVTFDASGYRNDFKVYSCMVNYPNRSMVSDSLELVWKPDLTTIKIVDTLRLIKVANDSMDFPHPYYYQGSSCLRTNILMIIRNDKYAKDTMLISTGGADPYALLVSPDWIGHGLPFIYPYKSGLFYLQRLMTDRSAKSLFYGTYRSYFLSYYSTYPNFMPNRAEAYISYSKMTKKNYSANDTISITLTGRVLNNGGCGDGNIIWTLQKFENEKWKIAIENCCVQMDCGIGPSILDNTTVPLILLKDKIKPNLATSPIQQELSTGKYRLVVYDDIYQMYFSDEFGIE